MGRDTHIQNVVVGLVCSISAVWAQTIFVKPEQIHLSYGASPSDMVVTWVTMNSTLTPKVEYGIDQLNLVTQGKTTKFTDGGFEHRVLFIHRVWLSGLTPGQSYMYHCGSDSGWSSTFVFKAMEDGSDWSPMLSVFGDLGNFNPRALPYLKRETRAGKFDAILHVGDFAYDFDTDNARVGDEFMRQIQPVASLVPYMVCVGNHETAYNFSNYRNRFTMPGGDGTGMYFSWNIGPAHIISFSTEVYFTDATTENIKTQYDWLTQDLIQANTPENRKLRPWIIVMGHKPMYCSNDDGGELCTNDKNPVCNGSMDHPYVNPGAPVHIITGSAGDREGQTKFRHKILPWSAFHTDDYGYTRVLVKNSTHLYLEEMSVDKKGEVIDKVWIVKDKHGPGLYDC